MAVKRCTTHTDHECYLVDWRPEGRKGPHPQRHFKGTEAEALAFWLDMVRLSRQAKHQPVGIDPKVADLIASWLEVYSNDHLPRTVKDVKQSLVPLLRYFGNMHLSELSAPIVFEKYKSQRLATKIVTRRHVGETVEAWQARLAEGSRTITKRTIAKELSYFSSFLKWCHRNAYLQQRIHIDNFTGKQTAPQKEIVPLHRESVTALVKAIEPQYRGILLTMTDAGLRISEALHVRAEMVDLKRRIITIIGKGNKRRFMVIASARLHKALSQAMEGKKEGFLWTNPRTKKPYASIKRALDRAAEKAGIDQKVYHHLMRHTFGTNAIVAGVSLKGVQDMLGHTSQSTTQKYLHMAGVYFQDEATKFAAYIDDQEPEEEDDEK